MFILPVLLVAAMAAPALPRETVRIEWSSYCFLGGARTIGVVRRYAQFDGGFRYENTFRERGGPLPGTFSNRDETTFEAVLSEVDREQVEAMRLRQALIVDGCAGHIAVTRGSVTTTISELETDFGDPAYQRFHRILHDLDAIAQAAHWEKAADGGDIRPLIEP